jgi:hypothetical protein
LWPGGSKGISVLRGNLRNNPVAAEFRHHLTLARLANQALHAGAQIELEPFKPEGGPGDLRATRNGSSVFIEVRRLGAGRDFAAHDRKMAQAMAFLHTLEREHDIHWDGEIPAEVSESWRRQMTDAAIAASRGCPVDTTVDGATIRAIPGQAGTGTIISGAMWEGDQGPRLLGALIEKARKTASTGAAWLWLEDAR